MSDEESKVGGEVESEDSSEDEEALSIARTIANKPATGPRLQVVIRILKYLNLILFLFTIFFLATFALLTLNLTNVISNHRSFLSKSCKHFFEISYKIKMMRNLDDRPPPM